MRVWEYSKQVNIETNTLIEKLRGLGYQVAGHNSILTREMEEQITNEDKQVNVLLAATECVPFVKSGGLADVIGALPSELNKLGAEVRVVLPKYGLIDEALQTKMKPITVTTIQIGWRNAYCGIETLDYEGITYYFIDNEYYFKRESLYGHYDDGERFAFYNRAVLELIDYIDFKPDILHLNDWQLGMVPLMLDLDYRHRPKYEAIKTIMTVHNVQYQGWFDLSVQTDLCNISDEHFYNGTTRQDGSFNFLKTGLVTADYITTVSPRYAKEIQDFFFGEGLDAIFRMRKKELKGIINGLDLNLYDPNKHPDIPFHYGLETIADKVKNKRALQIQFGLEENVDIPIVVMVSRLVDQKGLDLLMYAFDEMMHLDFQMIILGQGEEEYENFLIEMTKKYPDQFKAYVGYNESIAQLLYTGGDLILIPSLFEPCGLNQMIAMRYGTIPIVRETGGLKDTVIPYNEYTMHGSGFGFKCYNAADLNHIINYALKMYHDKDHFNELIKAAMTEDFSWRDSAKAYLTVYKKLKQS